MKKTNENKIQNTKNCSGSAKKCGTKNCGKNTKNCK
jgi:hypothetical protein